MSFKHALYEKYGMRAKALRAASLVGPPPDAPADASCVYVAHGECVDCPHLASLDLSRSLLASWADVACIAAHLPLTHLTLQHVRLAMADVPPFPHLAHLSLGDSATDWQCAVSLSQAMPKLTSLELAMNGITSLGVCAQLPSLTTLNLEDNALHAWDDIVYALASIPHLTKLVLTGNNLAHICPAAKPAFPCLSEIHIARNALRSEDLMALETYLAAPAWSLVTDAHDRQTRLETIAQLPKLTELNHTLVTREERVEAERYYLTRTKPGDPRYDTLVHMHGAPATAPLPTMHDKVLHLHYVHAQMPPSLDTLANLRKDAKPHTFLKTTALRTVHRRLVALCHVAPSSDVWAVLAAEPEPIFVQMDDALRDLAWYGVSSGDLLVVSPKAH